MRGGTEETGQITSSWADQGRLPGRMRHFSRARKASLQEAPAGSRGTPAGPHKGHSQDREPMDPGPTQMVVGEKAEHTLGSDHRQP